MNSKSLSDFEGGRSVASGEHSGKATRAHHLHPNLGQKTTCETNETDLKAKRTQRPKSPLSDLIRDVMDRVFLAEKRVFLALPKDALVGCILSYRDKTA